MVRYAAVVLAVALLVAACTSLVNAPSTQLEANKAVARRALAALQEGNLQVLNEIYEPNGLVHTSRGTQSEHGPYSDLKGACPMCSVLNPRDVTVDLILAEGDLVTARSTWHGKHVGEYRGVPPSGKDVTVTYTNVFRIHNGRIAENWVAFNQLALVEQLGLTLCPANPRDSERK
jgi:ketosteroid isomerase-like protein